MLGPLDVAFSSQFDARCVEVFGSLERADEALAELVYEFASQVGSFVGRRMYTTSCWLGGWLFDVIFRFEMEDTRAVLSDVDFVLRRAA